MPTFVGTTTLRELAFSVVLHYSMLMLYSSFWRIVVLENCDLTYKCMSYNYLSSVDTNTLRLFCHCYEFKPSCMSLLFAQINCFFVLFYYQFHSFIYCQLYNIRIMVMFNVSPAIRTRAQTLKNKVTGSRIAKPLTTESLDNTPESHTENTSLVKMKD